MVVAAQLSLEPRLTLAMRPSQEMVAFAQLIAMSEPELDLRVEEELRQNPALVRVEPAPASGEGGVPGGDDRSSLPVSAVLADMPDLLDRDRACHTMADELVAEARLIVAPEARWLVEVVVGELDHRGYLRSPLADIADRAGVPVGAVALVIRALREVGPCDLAAMDVRESLLLQLEALNPGPARDIARRIVRDHHDALVSRGGVRAVAARLEAEMDTVCAGLELIRARCRPHPAPGLWDAERPFVPRIRPDIVVAELDDGTGDILVRLGHSTRATVAVDDRYRVALTAAGNISGTERDHLRAHLRRAEGFIHLLAARESTLRLIAHHVVTRQIGFTRHGDSAAVPLTRAAVAADLGLHESTVSRAVADKSVQLPSGAVIAFDRFFGGSIAVVDALRSLVAGEDRPRSDAELAASLGALGHAVARRTVAKYREQLGIPAAAHRRSRRPGEPAFA